MILKICLYCIKNKLLFLLCILQLFYAFIAGILNGLGTRYMHYIASGVWGPWWCCLSHFIMNM